MDVFSVATSAKEVMFSSLFFWVSGITQKLLEGLLRNLVEGWIIHQGDHVAHWLSSDNKLASGGNVQHFWATSDIWVKTPSSCPCTLFTVRLVYFYHTSRTFLHTKHKWWYFFQLISINGCIWMQINLKSKFLMQFSQWVSHLMLSQTVYVWATQA